jgi:dephospho-CoA kinase
MKRIVGLTGKKGAGKTTVADFFVEFYDFQRVSFADLLKSMLIKANLCTFEECYITKTPQSRMLMQKIGTEIVREQIDSHYWEKKMKERIDSIEGDVVVDDCRFLSEAELIREYGGKIYRVIKITNYPEEDLHRSETEQEQIIVDETIMALAGDIGGLREWVKSLK